VKHLKTDKRSHLSGNSVRMQATIFGGACMEKARALRVNKEKDFELWNDDDVEFQLGLENWNREQKSVTNPRRIFNAWLEDWELISLKINDVVEEVKLFRKYGGLKWFDPDTKKKICCTSTYVNQ